jgi:X-X-X-Leu-X-X-Gly heptad repeat protein
VAEQARPTGLVITDDNGNYYYLRPEILAQAKMPEEDVKKLKSGAATASGKTGELSDDALAHVAGGVVNMSAIKISAPQVQTMDAARAPSIGGRVGGTMMSTIMCPW